MVHDSARPGTTCVLSSGNVTSVSTMRRPTRFELRSVTCAGSRFTGSATRPTTSVPAGCADAASAGPRRPMIAATITRNSASTLIERLRSDDSRFDRAANLYDRAWPRKAASPARPPLLESARESPVPRFNEFYLNLNQSYLFAEIRRRTKVFTAAHPDVRLGDLGVGDVTQALPPAVGRALHEATDDMARRETFKGYGPYVGYEFLRADIAAHDFGARGVKIAVDEVFVSDGGKSDSANLQEIVAQDCVVALMDPVYPVYADSNVVAGRSGRADESGRYAGIVYLPCTAENSFQPALRAARGSNLPLLSEQPDRCGGDARGARPLSRVRARGGCRHPIRRRLRGLHRRPGGSALDLRDRRRARGRDRVPELFKERRLHRDAPGLHDRAEGAAGAGRRRQDDDPQRALDSPDGDEIQRAALHHPEGRGGRLHARGAEASAGADRLLYGERADHRRRALGRGLHRLRRPQRAVHLGPHAALGRVLGFLRSGARASERGRRAGRRLRAERRGLFPAHRVRLTRADRRGDRADQDKDVRGSRSTTAPSSACDLARVCASRLAVDDAM